MVMVSLLVISCELALFLCAVGLLLCEKERRKFER